jgi:hypothetical protein
VPSTAGPEEGFDVASWLGFGGSDCAVAFFPSGRAVGHNLPVHQGRYYLLAVQGVDDGGAPVAQRLNSVYSISVSPLGDVAVEPGVPGAPAGLLAQGSAPPPPMAAAPAQSSAAANQAPQIQDLQVLPQANDSIYGGGVHSVGESVMELYPEEANADGSRAYSPVTLALYATDLDGDPLSFKWSAAPEGGAAGTGAFTYPESTRMVRLSDGSQAGRCQWQPPPQGQDAQRWTLSCQVSDGRGGVAHSASNPAFRRSVALTLGGKIALETAQPSPIDLTDEAGGVFRTTLDGTGGFRAAALPDGHEFHVALAPGGERVAFCQRMLWDMTEPDLWMATTDGSGRPVNLSNTPGDYELQPRFSPGGDRIAFYQTADYLELGFRVMVVAARAGATPVAVTPASTKAADEYHHPPETHLAWSPDGRWVMHERDAAGDTGFLHTWRDLCVALAVPPSGTPHVVRLVDGDVYHVTDFAWSPQGDHVAFTAWQGAPDAIESSSLYCMRVDLSVPGLNPGTPQKILDGQPDRDLAGPQFHPSGNLLFVYSTTGDDGQMMTLARTGPGADDYGGLKFLTVRGLSNFFGQFVPGGSHLLTDADNPSGLGLVLAKVPSSVPAPLNGAQLQYLNIGPLEDRVVHTFSVSR